MDVVNGMLTAALDILSGAVIVMIGGVKEALIKLLIYVTVGVSVMMVYAVMGDAILDCSSVWDVMVGEAVIGVVMMALTGLLVMVSDTLLCVVTRLVCNKYTVKSWKMNGWWRKTDRWRKTISRAVLDIICISMCFY